MTCESCGAVLEVGSWPFCPHGAGTYTNIPDEIPGGFVQENFGHVPETFYSRSAMARRAKELHLEPFVRWSGPNDRHVTRWAMTDPQTMKNAEALVTRVTS